MTAQGVWRFGAVLFGLLGLFSAVVFVRLPWRSGADFDLTGFFWALQNLPKLVALVSLVIFFAMALWCWIRALGRLR